MSMNNESQDLLGENLDTDAGKAASILGDPSKRLSHILGCGLVDIQLIHLEDDRPIVTPSTVVMSIRTIIDRIGLLTIRQYSLSDLNAFAFNVGAAVTTAFYKTKAEVALRIQDHLLLASTSYLDLRDARSWRGHLVWERYAPISLDWGFHEATFYRVVTTWYSQDIVSLLYSCFVQLDGVLFSKEKIDNVFRQAYETYSESLLSIDAVKSPLVRDSIFDESCWPLSASQKYSFEGFRDASFAFVAYYEKYRQELHQTHFKADVTTLVNSHVSKNLFYLYRLDRHAPLVVESLQHVSYCFMKNTFVLYGTVALQRYDNGFGFPDDKRSASPVYLSSYPTVYRYDAKRPADSFALSGTCEMRKKTKIALDEDDAKRKLAVRAAKKESKVAGKSAGGLRKCPIEKKLVEEIPSGTNNESHSLVAASVREVTPMTTRKATRASSVSSKDSSVDDEGKSNGLYVPNHDDDLPEDFMLLHGLSQDSFQHSNRKEDRKEDPMVRKVRSGGNSSGSSVGSTCGEGSQEEVSSSPEDASEALLNRTNRVQKLETMMFKERQTLENLIQSMRALQLARKQQEDVGENTVKEVRRRLWLYGFLLRSQRVELHQCLSEECNEHGYDKNELMDIMNKVPGTK